jgi:uncharacterized protein (TIGR02145 family)
MKRILTFIFTLTTCILNSQSDLQNRPVGGKDWTIQNAMVTKFRNGDPLKETKTKEEWEAAYKAGEPAYCFHKNDPSTAATYGLIYNVFAVRDARFLAPVGYRIPTTSDAKALVTALQEKTGKNVEASGLKSADGWIRFFGEPAQGGDGSGGLNIFPVHNPFASWYPEAGRSTGIFLKEGSDKRNWCLMLNGDYNFVQVEDFGVQNLGLPVRFVKNTPEDEANELIGNTVALNNEEVTINSFQPVKYLNGDEIPLVTNAEDWLKACLNKTGARCHINWDPKKPLIYNIHAVRDVRGIIPKGWRLPYYDEPLLMNNQKLNLNIGHLDGNLTMNNDYPGYWNLGKKESPESDIAYYFYMTEYNGSTQSTSATSCNTYYHKIKRKTIPVNVSGFSLRLIKSK